jgi:hypothetical protein
VFLCDEGDEEREVMRVMSLCLEDLGFERERSFLKNIFRTERRFLREEGCWRDGEARVY